MTKFVTKLSNEKLRNWKLPIKLSLLIVKPMYFSNLFGLTFILRLNLPRSCIIRWESYFFRLWNTTEIFTISIGRVSIFFSNMTMILYFNIIINIIIITDPTFSRVLKILIVFLSHHKFFVKMFFYLLTATFITRSYC